VLGQQAETPSNPKTVFVSKTVIDDSSTAFTLPSGRSPGALNGGPSGTKYDLMLGDTEKKNKIVEFIANFYKELKSIDLPYFSVGMFSGEEMKG
jgi:hypothetical protein